MTRLAPKFTIVRRVLALSGNQCAFPDCSNPLIIDDTFVGELAHIYAAEEGGPRYNANMDDEQRRDFPNLMYLCGYHHTIIDKKELVGKFSAEWLIEVKSKHEAGHKDAPYDVPDQVVEQAIDEINIVQANVLMNGNQTNIQQNFFNDAAVNASKALSQVIESSVDNDFSSANDSTEAADDDGFLDRMADAEVTIPLWNKTIQDMTVEINRLTPVLNQGVDDLKQSDKMNKGISGRRHVFKKTAAHLDPIAVKIEALGTTYETQFKVVNSGINAILDTANMDRDKAKELSDFFEVMKDVVKSSIEGLNPVDSMLEQMGVLEKFSTDMKRTLAKVRKGLSPMSESRSEIASWAVRIDEINA